MTWAPPLASRPPLAMTRVEFAAPESVRPVEPCRLSDRMVVVPAPMATLPEVIFALEVAVQAPTAAFTA